jgi:hypothetical protein
LAPSARRCSRGVYSDSLERGATGLTAAGSEFSQKMQQSRAADETPSGRPYGEPAAISKSTLPRFRYVAKVKSTPGAELEPQLSISSPSVVAIEAPATATIQHSRRRPQTSLRAAERNSDWQLLGPLLAPIGEGGRVGGRRFGDLPAALLPSGLAGYGAVGAALATTTSGQYQYARQLSESCVPWWVRGDGEAARLRVDELNSTSLVIFQCLLLAKVPRCRRVSVIPMPEKMTFP